MNASSAPPRSPRERASLFGALSDFRFDGDVFAAPEGTPIFPGEPILEITAPIGQAQVVETLVVNQISLQTVLASKAARVVEAAAGRPVVDFGARRAQGLDAALKGARAFAIAGVSATSLLAAGARYRIPVTGTMAHSFVQAFDDELEAFAAFAEIYPSTVLLVDTYDTLEGVRRAIELAHRLGDDCRLTGVRLDSGDLEALSRAARGMLDEAGLERLKIVASGGLNERRVKALVKAGAPIDVFGVGTEMSVASDAPALDIAYKLTEFIAARRVLLDERLAAVDLKAKGGLLPDVMLEKGVLKIISIEKSTPPEGHRPRLAELKSATGSAISMSGISIAQPDRHLGNGILRHGDSEAAFGGRRPKVPPNGCRRPGWALLTPYNVVGFHEEGNRACSRGLSARWIRTRDISRRTDRRCRSLSSPRDKSKARR